MKHSALLSIILFLLLGHGCSTLNGSAPNGLQTVNSSDIDVSQKAKVAPEKYVQILDELISNGCNVSMFEMIERNKVLDMKIACK